MDVMQSLMSRYFFLISILLRLYNKIGFLVNLRNLSIFCFFFLLQLGFPLLSFLLFVLFVHELVH